MPPRKPATSKRPARTRPNATASAASQHQAADNTVTQASPIEAVLAELRRLSEGQEQLRQENRALAAQVQHIAGQQGTAEPTAPATTSTLQSTAAPLQGPAAQLPTPQCGGSASLVQQIAGVHVTGMLAGSVTCATTARVGSTRVLNAPKSLGIGPFPPPEAPDHQPATKNVPTPVSVDRLAFWLEGYDSKKAEFLLDGFRHGFRVGFQGKVTSIVHKNLKSAALQPQVVDQHIKKKISAGRMHGPFVSPPFPQFQCSPVGLVEKKAKGEFRMIHHLSFPEGQSINDGIGPEHSHVRYATIEEAIMVVRTLCAKAFMCKTDVKHAFRIIPVHPDEYHLFVFQWKGCFYVDLALQMGCSASCKIFEAFRSAVEWIGRKKLGLNMVHILDDFFLASVSKEVGTFQFRSFLEMCSDLGLPMSPEKTFGPQTTMSFVGFEIDTVEEEFAS
ncbi:uncharacterized protein [Littorina saxatilis]|uniref:uncharacterized protein n=1 Tax=Littorina saxatilis TaxID=31220 RepID=UPI0038B5B5DF